MTKLTLSVTQISNYIKSIFDNEELLLGVSVFGEITNLKPSARAIYFDIKDADSALPCVCFDQYLMSDFKFGDKVTVTGKLNYYAKTGKLSFIASKVEKFGVGDLYKQYIELKDKLEKEGIFDLRHKKELPEFPQRVGVVTSETGAVIRDIVRVARKKNKTTDIVLYPVKVQGVGADKEIIKGIEFLDNYNVDLIIVARGGGSFEDYQPFNTEQVVRAVFNCKKPVVSAIGHENDWSLIDFVADVRASTPSVASEVAFPSEEELMAKAYSILKMSLLKLEDKNRQYKVQTDNFKEDLYNKMTSLLKNRKARIDEFASNFDRQLSSIIDGYANKVDKLAIRIGGANPLEIMRRGFSQSKKSGGQVVRSIKDVATNDTIVTTVIDGEIISTVTKIKEK